MFEKLDLQDTVGVATAAEVKFTYMHPDWDLHYCFNLNADFNITRWPIIQSISPI